MLVQNGRVVSVDPRTGEVRVEFEPATACAACAAGKGCGLGIFARLFNRRARSLTVLVDESDAIPAPGDRIQIAISENWLLRATLWLYGFPLLAALAGAATGTALGAAVSVSQPAAGGMSLDALTAAGAVTGIVMAMLTQRRFTPYKLGRAQARIGADSAPLVAGCRLRH